jgi:hypothetical protein
MCEARTTRGRNLADVSGHNTARLAPPRYPAREHPVNKKFSKKVIDKGFAKA